MFAYLHTTISDVLHEWSVSDKCAYLHTTTSDVLPEWSVSMRTATYHYWWCFTWVISQCAQRHTITGDVSPEWSVSVHSDIPLLAMFYLSDQSVCTLTYHYWQCFTWVISQRAQRQTITGDVLPEWSVSVHSDRPLLAMFYLSDQSVCTATYHYWWCFTWVISQRYVCLQHHSLSPGGQVGGLVVAFSKLGPWDKKTLCTLQHKENKK